MDSYQKATAKIEQFCYRDQSKIGKLSGYGTDTVYCRDGSGSYFAGAGEGFKGFGRGHGHRIKSYADTSVIVPCEVSLYDCHG